MVRRMRALYLACALGASSFAVACAPVQNKTHFQRWDEYAAQTATEEAKSAADKPKPKGMGDATMAPSDTGSTGSSDTYSEPSGTTPPISRTSTASSRVVRPAETPPPADDDDVIY